MEPNLKEFGKTMYFNMHRVFTFLQTHMPQGQVGNVILAIHKAETVVLKKQILLLTLTPLVLVGNANPVIKELGLVVKRN